MTSKGLTDRFQTSEEVFMGASCPPNFLTAVLSLVETTCSAQTEGFLTDKLALADEINEMAETPGGLRVVPNEVLEVTSSFGMIINASKTQAICCSQKP